MLTVFTISYLLRFIGDYLLIPLGLSSGSLTICKGENDVSLPCVKAFFIYYYVWTSILYDGLPLILIAIFHFKSFK